MLLKPRQKQLVLGIVLGGGAVILIGGIILALVVRDRSPNELSRDSSTEAQGLDLSGLGSASDCDTQEGSVPSQNDTRNYILDNINRIVATEPQTGSRWSAIQFEFIDNQHSYVVYTDGATTARLLVKVERSCLKLQHTVLARFRKEGDNYALDSGEDFFHDIPAERRRILEFYEPDQEWITLQEREAREEAKRQQQEAEARAEATPTEELLQD